MMSVGVEGPLARQFVACSALSMVDNNNRSSRDVM